MDFPRMRAEFRRRVVLSNVEEFVTRSARELTFTNSAAATNLELKAPIYNPYPLVLKRIGVLNGSPVSGTISVSFSSRNVSPTIPLYAAQVGTNQFQWFDVSDTYLCPGWVWYSVSIDNTSGKFIMMVANENAALIGGSPVSNGLAISGSPTIMPILVFDGKAL